VAVPLEVRLRGNARVIVHELPGVAAAASAVHTGSYDRISGAYRALTAWTQANGYRASGPNREIYLQGFESGPDPSSYVTELQLPVQQLSALSLTGHKKEETMEPRIVTKEAFAVVGLPFTGFISNAPYEEEKGNNEIGLVWDEFNRRCGEIKNVCGPVYGLCFGMPNEREPWYIAGIEVSRADEIPAGMLSMSVPAQKYAVFPCTLGALGATYRYITQEWQPRTGHEHADAPDFELYDEEFDPSDPQHGKLSVYWPIEETVAP
jgi:AraC family transcriptional regulator